MSFRQNKGCHAFLFAISGILLLVQLGCERGLESSSTVKNLNQEQFFDQFSSEWERLSESFYKLEVLQSYSEPDDPSYKAFERGDLDEAARLVSERVSAQKELFDSASRSGVRIVRVRIVERPISTYLKYEFEAYKVSSQLGEEIFLVDRESIVESEIEVPLRDCLLFDQALVLRHNYSSDGELLGALEIRDPETVQSYHDLFNYLLELAVPFETFPID